MNTFNKDRLYAENSYCHMCIKELEKENAKLTSLLSDVQDERKQFLIKQFLIKQGHICLDELSAEINQVLSSKLADLGGDL